MSVYDDFADSPNQIRAEGQEITIKFQRTSDTTARISWNIPPPMFGCSSENQAYDGIVITVSNSPANYLSTSPKDGVYYEADPTVDFDIHAGSKIDKAYVIGAFYHDKTTTVLDIDGIKEKTPYYVSGYAVDAVGRYHREGVHAYSLPTGAQSYVTEDLPAKHEIQLYSVNPITPKTPTGLVADTEYTIPIKIDCNVEDFTINGSNALTYCRLVNELNRQFSMYRVEYSAPSPPHTGDYYKDTNNFYQWNGYYLNPVNVATVIHDPLTPVNGMYWLNPVTGVLHVYESNAWVVIPDIIESTVAPTELSAYTIWFDGTTVRVWENGHWCDYTTYISDRNPQLPPLLHAGDFWYDELNNETFKWNETTKAWEDVLVIYFDKDPNTLTTGDFWYDEKISKIKRFVGSNWNVLTGVIYLDSTASGEFPPNSDKTILAGTYWFDTLQHKFYKRNSLNTEWDTVDFVSFPVNPKNRKSCDLWWNSSSSVDDLYVWETVSSSWVHVNNFFKQENDPNSRPFLDPHTAWVNLSNEIHLITPSDCSKTNYIFSDVDPRNITIGTIWKDSNGRYFRFDGTDWILLDSLIVYNNDPYNVIDGYLWYNPITGKLYKYTNSAWDTQCLFVDKSIIPSIGDRWYDTINEKSMEWNGSSWHPTIPFVHVELVKRTCLDTYDKLVFSTSRTGCDENFEVLATDKNTLFDNLINSVIYMDPIEGTDGVEAGPMYMQLGVGDDGSPDERRILQEQVRMAFGAPSVRVELTKHQIDTCIDNALLVLRKYSSYSYQKAMFFLDLKRNQQVYLLTNRCVGFNKIVDVLAIHRAKSGAFRSAYSQNDNFTYAALQQLYTMGTFDMLTYHLASSYVEELEKLFASKIMYQWVERKRELKLFQLPKGSERVLVEAIIERTEQDLITNRETSYWIRRWCINEAKGMLAQIRGKFATLPGPNGTTTLNANELQTQLEQERTNLMEELFDKGMQDIVGIGMKAHLILG